ncbi:MAG: response regulator [Candidatus Eremiobacteraeota bacterium]|nr:response regulator [Candidatus Eremiobacteraeota bacterium]
MELPTVSAVSSEYRYLWVDENWCRVFAMAEEQVIGRTLSEIWGPQVFDNKYKRLFDQAFQGQALVQRVHTRDADGRKRVKQIHLAPIRSAVSELFVVSTVTDLTDSEIGPEETSGGPWNLMFQGEKAMNLLLTPEGQILQFSQALSAYLSDEEANLEGKKLIDLLEATQTEDVVDEFYQALRKAIHGQEQVFDVTLTRGQQGLGDFQFCIRPQLSAGVLEFYHLSAFEVTERNASLRETQNELHSLFQVSPAPMLIGLKGTIVQANPAALAMLGVETEHSLAGTKIAELFPTLLTESGPATRLRRPDGEILQVQMTVTPMRLAGQYHQLYLLYNLSEQMQIQEALQAATASAELASRSKTSFLTTMSHEIRTPLNGILGLLYLLQLSRDEGKKEAYLEKLGQATRGMLAIINDVLDYSAYEDGDGGRALEVEDFDLSDVLEEVAQAMPGWTKPEQQLQTEVLVAPTVPQRLRGDAGKLRRILSNLCHNAVRFTPNGTVRVSVDLLHQAESLYTLEFTVADTGIGIEPEFLKRLFTPFQQGDSSASRSYGGVGLGLFLSQRFVEMLGGTIRAESQLGQGTRFLFSVRLTSPLRPGDLSPAAPPTTPSTGPGGLQGQVLVVDDNDINQEVAAEMLRQLGIIAHIAGGGWQALEMVQLHSYDAILMDLQMPGMDGLETAARLREKGATMPILALTANTRLEDRAACRAAGMDDFLAKPVEPQALWQALQKFLPAGEMARVEPGCESDFPDLPGVNCRQGLERLGGNRTLFRNLLVQFARRHQSFAQEWRQTLEAGDLSRARDLSHTLKGLAGNLGMEELSTLAKQMEAGARAGRLSSDLLEALEQQLAQLLPALQALEIHRASQPSADLDAAQLVPLLEALRAQLLGDLGEAFRLAEQLAGLTQDTSLDPQFAQLQTALDNFDLDKAGDLANQMLEWLAQYSR